MFPNYLKHDEELLLELIKLRTDILTNSFQTQKKIYKDISNESNSLPKQFYKKYQKIFGTKY